ncbi:MAG: DNA repair protein RecO [Candidatus Brocadiia bacterium]
MAEYCRTEGICLRRLAYSNTSQVAGFLTPDQGRLSFIAKGITRAPKKGIRTGLELLGRYGLVYTRRPAGSLQNLTDQWLQEEFRGLRRSLPRLLCGYYAAELALNFTVEADPCPRLYAATLGALRRFAEGRRLGLTAVHLELAVLREHGSLPAFDRCVACGRDLPARGAVTFSAPDGGPLCRRCEQPEQGQSIPLRADLLAHLHTLATGEEEPVLTPKQTVALSTALRFQMRYILGRELRMWTYLQRRRLSKSLRHARRHASS